MHRRNTPAPRKRSAKTSEGKDHPDSLSQDRCAKPHPVVLHTCAHTKKRPGGRRHETTQEHSGVLDLSQQPPSTSTTHIEELPARLRAVADFLPGTMREMAGLHAYDGKVADLSPEGVRAGVETLGGTPFDDPHDEAHASAFEKNLRHEYAELELHRSNPLLHAHELDLAGYDRPYAPQDERDRARIEHLRRWPQVVDNALASLDRIPAPVARSVREAIAGAATNLPDNAPDDVREAALSAHSRLLAHVDHAAREGTHKTALGEKALGELMGASEATKVDLTELASWADTERTRLRAGLAEAAGRLAPGQDPDEFTQELTRSHPAADQVLTAARGWTRLVLDFTAERDLVLVDDGECRVEESPESQRWVTAMMSGGGPWEAEAPSYYFVTPPDPAWSPQEAEEWLEIFSHTTLPAVSVHEVAPGHFSHWRHMRTLQSPVRRALHSMTFAEGWAHYAEEMLLEEGFGAYAAERVAGEDFLDGTEWTPDHYEIGVWVEALIRVTRLSVAIGVHTGEMTVEQGATRFAQDTPLRGRAALSEAHRATFDPTYGRYTWGKLEILRLRERARKEWGSAFSLPRFHRALLDLGSPPIGLIGTAIDRG